MVVAWGRVVEGNLDRDSARRVCVCVVVVGVVVVGVGGWGGGTSTSRSRTAKNMTGRDVNMRL